MAKICQKITTRVFNLKSDHFSKKPKSHLFATFEVIICHKDLPKIAQSGHTGHCL